MAVVDDALLARLRELSDRNEIRDIVYRRAESTDRGDLEQALSCYPPDGTEDHEGFDGPVTEFNNTGRYLDDFERRDGRRLIKHRRCAYEWSHGMEPTERWWSRTMPPPAG